MPTPRRYTKRQKAAAVVAAEMASMTAASEATGIPLSTIDRWMDEPWAVELRTKTREDLGEDARLLAHRTLALIKDRLPSYEPKDLNVIFGILVDKAQLLTGAPTSRTETRALTDGLEDHEKQALRDAIDRILHPEPVA